MIATLAGLRWLKSPYRVLDRHLREGQITFRMRLPVLGDCLVTGDPHLIGEISRNRNLIGGRGTEALRPVVGDHSLIVLEGVRHDAHRAVFLPLFFSADPKHHDALNRKWVDSELSLLRPGVDFSGMQLVARITLNAIIEVMFGELPAQEHRRAVSLVEAYMASFRNPAVLFLKFLHIDLGRWSPWGRFVANRSALHGFIREQIARVRAERPPCALTQIVESRAPPHEPLSDEEIVSEVVTFVLFGHDTSAAAMGWVLNDVLRDKKIVDRARREIADACVADPSVFADADDLPFVRSVIQESMRLSPVVVHLTRHAVAPTTIGTHSVREGERVLPCMYLAHRNAAVFECPTSFVADRFLVPQPQWRHAYFPFGLGTRLCAGMPLALRQMVVILARILETVQLQIVEPERVTPKRKMVLIVPSGGPLLRRT